MEFVLIGAVLVFMLDYTKRIDTRKFIGDTEPYFRFLMEEDYGFLVNIKYGDKVDINQLFAARVRNGLVTIICLIFVFSMYVASFINILVAVIIGYVIFKLPYTSLKKYYKANLSRIDSLLPYYLKSLEILIQHYTVPVALSKSIKTAPEIFQPGLKTLVARIDAGDSTVEPYMDFAKEYPVRDSMRMMRLLYRLGLGSQENKHEQLVMFARTVSSLQNKAREQKYKARLETMENKTMKMLFVTGGGLLLLLLMSMMMLMNL